jgi:hypothetical protein
MTMAGIIVIDGVGMMLRNGLVSVDFGTVMMSVTAMLVRP